MKSSLLVFLVILGPTLLFAQSQGKIEQPGDLSNDSESLHNSIIDKVYSSETLISDLQNVKISITEKHREKLEKISTPGEKLKKYRKYYSKDSCKIMKNHVKLIRKKADSLYHSYFHKMKNGIIDSIGVSEQYGQFFQKDFLDSGVLLSKSKSIIKPELVSYLSGLEEYQKIGLLTDEYPELANWLKNYANQPGMINQLPDSILNSTNEKVKAIPGFVEKSLGETNEIKELQKKASFTQNSVEELKQKYQGEGEQYINQARKSSDPNQLKSEVREFGTNYTKEFIAENLIQLQELNNKLASHKRKYSSISDINDPGTAKKRNSLKGRPFDEKIVLGGNFDIQIAEPVLVDVSPIVGFRLNKRLTSGIGGTYRFAVSFNSQSINANYEHQVYGFNSFISYDVIERLFAYGQYDYLNKKEHDLSNSDEVQSWEPGLMAGIGRSFNLHTKISGTIILLYNVLESDIKNPSGNKFQIKFGFQTNELTFKKTNRSY